MIRHDGNDLIRQLQNVVLEEIDEDKRYREVKTKCRSRIELLMGKLINLGQGFEVAPNEVLYKLGVTKRRFDVFQDFMFVLRKMKLPEDVIEKLSQGAKGEDLIFHLKENGWLQIPGTNIWIKNQKVNVQGWLENPEYDDIQFMVGASRVLATDLSDKLVYLLDGVTGEKLTSGFHKGEILSDGIIKMIDKQDNRCFFYPDGERVK